jgi:RNA polymerase sigma-70 factor (ECF subfamily)
MDIARQTAANAAAPIGARAARLSIVTAHEGRGAMPTPDELNELAQAVAERGDRQAFAVLFKHFAPRVKTYLVRRGCAATVAEELAQETMVLLWRKAATFDPAKARVSTWIFTIARNLRTDQHRQRSDVVAEGTGDAEGLGLDPELVVAEAVDPAAGPEARLSAAQGERRLRAAMAQLSVEQARILQLSYYGDQAHANIARDLLIPLGTVKSRIRLAVAHLRRLLSETEP